MKIIQGQTVQHPVYISNLILDTLLMVNVNIRRIEDLRGEVMGRGYPSQMFAGKYAVLYVLGSPF